MKYRFNPSEQIAAATELTMLAAETQAVMTMRIWGMAGLWNVTKGEDARMVSEKLPAWMAAYTAGTKAMLSGRPDRVLPAMVKPLRRKTKANTRRLAKRGLA
ncbi:MAG: antifreeze protein [Shimia sp.]